MIEEINGFSSEEVRTLYLPVNTKQLTPKKDYTRKNKVIYAARICNQKIADIAVEVGRLLGEQGIELHFYGNIDPEYAENDRFLNMISSIPSVKYMGTFDSFGLLPLDDYDMYLLTTRTEGLANVIIEACVSNIYIVSVAVGGLPECIENHENGYLLPDTLEKFNPQAYCNAIMAAYESNKFADKKAIDKKARKVQERHSQDTYSANVKQIYDL
jgi:glycosyltransferase involved in cell wall biosynthesis